MAEEPAPATPEGTEQEAPQPSHKIEASRSSRARCRTCRKKIDKDVLRIGILYEGPYGPSYGWHHLKCAARAQFDEVEEAYRIEAWTLDLEVPTLEELKEHKEKAEERKATKKELPYAERAKSNRSKCKHSGEPIDKDAWRIVLSRGVEFGGMTRNSPTNVLPQYVAAELENPECLTEAEGFFDSLRENSTDLTEDDFAELESLVGDLGA